MKFSLNLVEIYNNMANEYDESIENFISYEEFVDKLQNGEIEFKIEREAFGDYLVVKLR